MASGRFVVVSSYLLNKLHMRVGLLCERRKKDYDW